MNLFERHWRVSAVERSLEERAELALRVCLGPHLLRFRRYSRLEHDNRLCRPQPFLDDIGISPVSRQACYCASRGTFPLS